MATKEKTLVIVESPTKAKTLNKFLGSEYIIDSSFGHVRDLPKSKLGVEVEKDFDPVYVIPTKARKQVNKLKKEAAKSVEVILATDEDREGEAIAFHLIEALDLHKKLAEGKVKRIVFHEITKDAILKAIDTPREVDMNMVNAQQARRMLDRLVGYELSPLLWKKVMRGLSAGRVQSVAMRLIMEREEEVRKFKPQEYFTITADIDIAKDKLRTALIKVTGKALPKPGIMNKEEVDRIVADLKKADYSISEIKRKEVKKNPLPPFITSTLQQAGVNRLGFSAKQTMVLAQKLYEKGYITYMRTDSVNLAKEALNGAHDFIKEKWGDKYLIDKPRKFQQKSKLAQEAHEAIRPTTPSLEADLIEAESGERKLYAMIWQRFMGSQMPEAIFEGTTIDIAAKGDEQYILRANGNVMKFDGYLKVWPTSFKEEILPEINEKEKVVLEKVESERHETQPPARFNEASLVKILEENGVGRPSTYASIISVIQTRNYVHKNDQKRFEPTDIGEIVNKLLVEHFPKIVDVGFTADIEEELDEVAVGVSNWKEMLKDFYKPFKLRLEKKYEELNKKDIMPEEKTDEKCDKCGKEMIIKRGRFGRFLACTGFPDCKNTKKVEGGDDDQQDKYESINTGIQCEECKEGELVTRRVSKGRARGKIFWGCNRYPKCKHAVWDDPTKEGEDKKKEEKMPD